MKKIFTLSALFIVFATLLAGCTKRSYSDYNDMSYWLSKENGVVVYSDNYCPYYVVETYNGYAIVRSAEAYRPYEGDEMYGNLSSYGYKDIYNYTENRIIKGEVMYYWLTYAEAQYRIDNLCYTYGRAAENKTIKQGLLKAKPAAGAEQ